MICSACLCITVNTRTGTTWRLACASRKQVNLRIERDLPAPRMARQAGHFKLVPFDKEGQLGKVSQLLEK